MEDDKDISPLDSSAQGTVKVDNKQTAHPIMADSEAFDPSTLDYSSVPLFEGLQASRSREDITREVIAHYSPFVRHVPQLICQSAEDMEVDPIFAAPSVMQAEGQFLAREHLLSGVRINIPRSSKLWAGDQLRLRWGSGTYCSPVGEPKSRKGPREIRWLSGRHLSRSHNGLIEVSYEVFRRSRLVGISEALTLMLIGEMKVDHLSKEQARLRAIRRRQRFQ
jgi:hypothetical protein